MKSLESLVFAKTSLDAALAAIDCGFWPVPISAKDADGKRPIGDNWRRCWTPSEIKSEFASGNADAVGLILGPGPENPIIDIDLDSDRAIDAMRSLFGDSPEYTLGFRASRGCHWLYQWDDRLQVINSAVKHWPPDKGVAEQIEIRLGCGKSAQTLIPPSWHKIAKISRSWIFSSFGEAYISQLPENVIQTLLKDLTKNRNNDELIKYEIEKRNNLYQGFTLNHPYIKKAIGNEFSILEQATEGSRNTNVYKAAWKITSLCESQFIDPTPVLADIAVIAARLGLPKEEYDATIRNGYRWGKANPRTPANLTSPEEYSESVKEKSIKTKTKSKEKAEAKAEHNGILPEDSYTDLKFARLVIDRYGDQFKYVEEWKEWAAWNESTGVWVKTSVRHHEFFKAFAVGDDEYLGSSAKIRSASSLCMSDTKILATPDNFDCLNDYINLENGVLDLINLQLLDHNPSFMATKQAAVKYDPSAKCPEFLKTLERVQPDIEIRQFLQRWLGTILTGQTLAESVVNYGDGANGKSTIFETIGMLMGSYYAKMPRGFIAKTKNERHPAELVTLYGARFALASETDISDALDESKIKMILGDGTITARGMNENFWTFTPTHKFAIAANHMPSIIGQDSGIWRRLAFVPWEVTIPEEERQPEYEKVLYGESSGILNWLIEGLWAYREIGLQIPEKIKVASREVKASSDWLSEFFNETFTTKKKSGMAEESRIRASQVYELYKKWAISNGSTVLPMSKAVPLFTKRVEDMGLSAPKPNNVKWYVGLRVKDENDHNNEIDEFEEKADKVPF